MNGYLSIIGLGCLVAAFIMGGCVGQKSMMNEAIDHGKAEYLTTEKGTKVWRWKP